MFALSHPAESYVLFTSIDGSRHDIRPESGEQFYQGNLLPNGMANSLFFIFCIEFCFILLKECSCAIFGFILIILFLDIASLAFLDFICCWLQKSRLNIWLDPLTPILLKKNPFFLLLFNADC